MVQCLHGTHQIIALMQHADRFQYYWHDTGYKENFHLLKLCSFPISCCFFWPKSSHFSVGGWEGNELLHKKSTTLNGSKPFLPCFKTLWLAFVNKCLFWQYQLDIELTECAQLHTCQLVHAESGVCVMHVPGVMYSPGGDALTSAPGDMHSCRAPD